MVIQPLISVGLLSPHLDLQSWPARIAPPIQPETQDLLFRTLAGGRLRSPLLGERRESLEIQSTAVRVLRGRVPVEALSDRLWIRLGEDYFRQIPGAEVSRIQDNRSLAVRCSKKAYEDHLRSDAHSFDVIPSLRLIQSHVADQALLHRELDDELEMAFPVPSVFEEILRQAFGDAAPRFVSVWGEILRDSVNEMHKKNLRPLGVSLLPAYLDDVKKMVHPFIFLYHDVYHAVMAAALPTALRLVWARLYDRVQGYPFPGNAGTLREALLDALTNHDIEMRPESLYMTLATVPFRPVTDLILEALEEQDSESGLDRMEFAGSLMSGFLGHLEAHPLKLNQKDEADWMNRLTETLGRFLSDLNLHIALRRAAGQFGV